MRVCYFLHLRIDSEPINESKINNEHGGVKRDRSHARVRKSENMNAIMPKIPIPLGFSWHVDVISYVSQGVSIASACGAAGISRATYYRHIRKYPYFKSQIDRAQILAEVQMLDAMKKAAGSNWRVYAWLLEKRFPGGWGSMRERLIYHGCTCGAARRTR